MRTLRNHQLAIAFSLALAAALAVAPNLVALADDDPHKVQETLSPAMKKGEGLYQRGQYKEAAEQFREEIRTSPDNAKAHCRLGACEAGMGNDDTAILEETTSAKLDPKYFLPHVVMGQVYSNAGKLDLAVKEFKQAVTLKPTSFLSHIDLGVALVQIGETDEAIRVNKEASEMDA
ncbi:MAG: tetratricopeptide repeat protein, partial [Terriglobales bacterium]